MNQVTAKRMHQHCDRCGHDTFVSYDGTTYGCENCHPANQGARVIKAGSIDPALEADNILARARNRGGSGAGDIGMIEHLLFSRAAELDQDRIEELKRALKIAKGDNLKMRTP